jgi:hypothetical protein
MEPNCLHLKQVHDMELGKPFKMAPKLNDKVFNPAVLERVNANLADAVFHSSTIKTLFYYFPHGFPEFKSAARSSSKSFESGIMY